MENSKNIWTNYKTPKNGTVEGRPAQLIKLKLLRVQLKFFLLELSSAPNLFFRADNQLSAFPQH